MGELNLEKKRAMQSYVHAPVAGYAALFEEEPDLGGDIILPGAFAAGLHRVGLHRVRMLFNHSPVEPLGVWESIEEDGMGLRVSGRLPDAARGAAFSLGLSPNSGGQ